jgi:hypothetical protein
MMQMKMAMWDVVQDYSKVLENIFLKFFGRLLQVQYAELNFFLHIVFRPTNRNPSRPLGEAGVRKHRRMKIHDKFKFFIYNILL